MDPQAQNGTPQPPPPPPGFVPMNQDTSQAGNAPPPPPGFVPMNASGSGAQPAETPRTETLTLQSNAMGKTPVTYTVPSDLTSNPPDPKTGQGEGTYKFWNAHGMPIMVPYSKALALLGHPEGALGSGQSEVDRFHQAYSDLKSQGFTLDDADVPRLYSDYAEDPRLKDVRAQNFYKSIPAMGYLRGAARTVAGGIHATGNQPPHTLDVLANTPNNPDPHIGAMQTGTEAAENVNEFMAAEGLLSGMTKILGPGVKLAEAGKVEQEIQKGSALGKLALTALKQGTIAGGQTYAKTGGDAGAAATAAGGTALASGALSTLGAGGAAIKTARAGVPEAAATGGADYAAEARGAAEPHLNRVSDAIESTRGGAANPGTDLVPRDALATVGEKTAQAKAPVLDVNKVLDQIHDFTGAADRLAEVNKAGYKTLDKITGDKFSELNAEVAAAQKASYKGVEGADALYKNKLAEMDDLIESTKGKVTPETVQALKSSWRQTYQLRDFGNIWDRNLNGVPGSSNVSAEQRGIDGKGLMRGLQQAVRNYGRPSIEQSLGPGRLENLENIARMNQTNPQRAAFNKGVWEVVRHLHHGAVLGGMTGGMAGNWEAGAAAGTAVAGGIEGYNAVMNALKANPKIAQNFMFALESGATAKRYGPFIAEMIQKSQTDASRERQAEEAPKEEGGSEQ